MIKLTRRPTKYVGFLAIYIFCTLLISCTNSRPQNEQPIQPIGLAESDRMSLSEENAIDGVMINNPDGSNYYQLKQGLFQSVINRITGSGVTGGPPSSYEDAIADGVMPIIFANRYTGEDIANTPEYSPGDFYLHFPTEAEPEYNFWQYMGDKDNFFDPDAVPEGERKPFYGSWEGETTDGRTSFTDIDVDYQTIADMDVNHSREFHNIPVDDDARAKIYIIYLCINEILLQTGDTLESVQYQTLDEYIGYCGRKNPAAWVNPYTGDPMKEVPWTSVPVYYYEDPWGDPLQQAGMVFNPDFPKEELPGNYSFTIDPGSSSRDPFSYAQFYFKMPDGSVAAYIGIGSRSE